MRSIAPLKSGPKQAEGKVASKVTTDEPALREVPLEQWLDGEQLAAHFLCGKRAARGWLKDGLIPIAFVHPCSQRGHPRFHPDVLPFLENAFKEIQAARRQRRREAAAARLQ